MVEKSVPSDLLPHVYSFLLNSNFHKAAKALQKASDEPLAAQSVDEAGLVEFYSFYQKRHAGKRTAVSKGEEEEEAPPAKRRKKAKDASMDSDDLEGGVAMATERAQDTSQDIITNGHGGGAKATKHTLDTSSNSQKKKLKKKKNDANETCDVEPGSKVNDQSSKKREGKRKSDTRTSLEFVGGGEPVMESTPASNGGARDEESSSDSSGSEEDDGTVQVGGCGLNGEATPALSGSTESPSAAATDTSGKKNKNRKSGGGSANPFRRVMGDVEVDPRLQDNSFEAKARSHGSWGEKANRDLKFTKGKSFRHEKTKKKRGTYKGGAIDTSVCSIKFDSD